MHYPVEDVVGLYQRQGYPELSNKQNEAFVIWEHVIFDKHPIPGLRHPSKNLLQSASVVAVVLSVHSIGLQIEFDHMQAFWISVVEATPHADFGYVEHAPFVIHPIPPVVQVEIAALH